MSLAKSCYFIRCDSSGDHIVIQSEDNYIGAISESLYYTIRLTMLEFIGREQHDLQYFISHLSPEEDVRFSISGQYVIPVWYFLETSNKWDECIKHINDNISKDVCDTRAMVNKINVVHNNKIDLLNLHDLEKQEARLHREEE